MPVESIEKKIAQRKEAIADKERQFNEDRLNRFSNKPPAREEQEDDDLTPDKKEPLLKEDDESEPPIKQEEIKEDDGLLLFEEEKEEDKPLEEEEDDILPNEELEEEGINKEVIDSWRKRVQEQGSARKEAETKLIESQAELEKLREDLEKEKEKANRAAAKNVNWVEHEDVKPLLRKMEDSIYKGASTIPDTELQQKFIRDSENTLIQKYYDATKEVKTLNDRIVADNNFETYLREEYDVADGRSIIPHIKDTLDTRMQIEDRIDSLEESYQSDASGGSAPIEENISDYKEVLEQLGELDDEFIETNPDAIETYVAKKYKEDDDFRKKAEKYKKEASEFLFGMTSLTTDQLDRVEKIASSEGITLKEYLKRRESNYKKQKQKFINDVFYGKMLMGDFSSMRKVYERHLANKKKRETAGSAQSKNDPPSPKKKEERQSSRLPGRELPEGYVLPTDRFKKS